MPSYLGVFEVIDDAPGRRDNDVRFLCKSDSLVHHVDTADDRHTAHADPAAQRLDLLTDLERKLTRRRQNQREQACV